MDLVLNLSGLDASVTKMTGGDASIGTELWTIKNGVHSPQLVSGSKRSEFPSRVVDWLLSHSKP
jgi:hypothetical protein